MRTISVTKGKGRKQGGKPIRRLRYAMCFLTLAAAAPWFIGTAFGDGAGHGHGHGEKPVAPIQPGAPAQGATGIKLLDLELLNQDGKPVWFASEALGDRIVVMDFIYTSCTTTCPVVSQIMARVRDELGGRSTRDVRLISISVDPATDTPERLKEYAGRLDAGPEWLWLTGYKPDVDRVLDGLGAYTPDFREHPGLVLVGDPRSGVWERFYSFPDPARIVARVDRLAAARVKASTLETKARDYFTDLPVVAHDGRELRFFTDLLKDKIVLITLFYTECTGMCPIINNKLSLLQDKLGDRLGKDVFFVSVTLDPETDTPEVLKDYAVKFEARDGWSFVTGRKADIATITRKLGQVGDDIAGHAPYLMVGDVKRAVWKKFRPDVPEEVMAIYIGQLGADILLPSTADRPG